MEKNNYPGKLVAIEGLDGCGKTTQIGLLRNWLETEGWATITIKRKTSKLISQRINEAKQARLLNPLTYSLIHAADFSELFYNEIIPALKAGFIVLFNKYIYTSIAKDFIRGNDTEWVQTLYDFALVPNITIYFESPLERALENMTKEEKEKDFYDSGMDLGITGNSLQSMRIYQKRLQEEYEKMAKQYQFKRISVAIPIQMQQNKLRAMTHDILT